MPRIGPAHAAHRRGRVAYVGTTHDEVVALQATIAQQTTNLNVTVDACKSQLDAGTLADWYAMARRSLAYVSESPGLLLNEEQRDRGIALLRDLAPWSARLESKGCTGVPRPAPVPAVPSPGPGFGGLFGGIFTGLSQGFGLAVLLFMLMNFGKERSSR